MIPKTIEDFEMLKTLDDHPYLDFWTEIGLNRPVDIMVVPHFRFDFVEILKNQGMENSVMIPNVQYLIDQERAAGDEIRKNMKDNRQMINWAPIIKCIASFIRNRTPILLYHFI